METKFMTGKEIRQKFNKIPVKIELNNIEHTTEFKDFYLLAKDITMGRLLYMLRQNLKKIHSSQGLYIYPKKNNAILPMMNDTINKIDERFKDDDGYLYLILCCESVFG
jgi:hypothetical protein